MMPDRGSARDIGLRRDVWYFPRPVAYQACYACQLLFEVDDAASGAAMPCPQCGAPLEAYTPEVEAEVVDASVDAAVVDLASAPASIVATHAFDGLSAAVREELAARQANPERAAKVRGTKVLDLNRPAGASDMLADAAVEPPPTAEVERHRPSVGLNSSVFADDSVPVETPTRRGPQREVDAANLPSRRTQSMPVVDVSARSAVEPRIAPVPVAVNDSGAPLNGRGGRGRIARLALVGAGAVALVAGALWALRGPTTGEKSGGGPTPAASVASSAPVQTEAARMVKTLTDALGELPAARGGEPLPTGNFVWVAGGPEGLSGSFGGVPGLPSANIPANQIDVDPLGEGIKSLSTQLGGLAGKGERLGLALHRKVSTRTLLLFAMSAYRAGFREVGLVVERPDGPGWLPLGVHPSVSPLPTAGAVSVSLGSMMVKADTLGAEGKPMSDGVGVPHKEGTNRPDLAALDARLDALQRAAPAVRSAIVYGNPEMALDELCTVLERVLGTADKGRFASVSLGVRAP